MHAQLCNTPMVSGGDPLPADVATPRPPAPRPLAPLGTQAVALAVDGGLLSSAAGVVLLTDLDDHLGRTQALAAGLSDPREARRIPLSPEDLLTPRVWHIAAGSEEANASHPLRDAPLGTLRRDRLPDTGAPWASHPPLSRCENRVARTALSRMALGVLEPCLASSDRPPQRLGRALEAPEAPVRGPPEPARYDGEYGGAGGRPLPLAAGLSGRLRTTRLHAQRCTGPQRLAVLQRLVKRLRPAWPDTLVLVRGASHCASPEVRHGIADHPARSAVTGLTRNAVLQARAREGVAPAQRASERSGPTGTRWHATRSQAGTWSCARRGVRTGAVRDQGVTPRLVVPPLEQARPTGLSQHSACARGQAAHASQAHTRSVPSARTAGQRFAATQWRLLGQAAASGFLETVRRAV